MSGRTSPASLPRPPESTVGPLSIGEIVEWVVHWAPNAQQRKERRTVLKRRSKADAPFERGACTGDDTVAVGVPTAGK